ncbi:MAG: hypothetical protein WAO02_05990 [Verrucomicrobiia bacterium]
MPQNAFDPLESRDELEVRLDGLPVGLPAEQRSLGAIRCHLESLALKRQRILYSLSVDGQPVNLALPMPGQGTFCRVEAGTVAVEELSLLQLKKAFQQTDYARECVETALALVLINDGQVACEVWWNLALVLKAPVLTLSQLPDNVCGASDGHTSSSQLRQWQLEQIASIIREVDEACHPNDTLPLSDALENRVLPWLHNLSELIRLWHETALAGTGLRINHAGS